MDTQWPLLRVERAAPQHGETEWNVYAALPTEWGPEEQLIGDVDDCDTEAEALVAGRQMWESRTRDYPCAD